MQTMRMYKRKNGVWYVELSRGKARSTGTADEKIAASIFKKMEREVLTGRLVALDTGRRVAISELSIEYTAARPDLSKDTLRMDRLALKSLGDVMGQSFPIKAITDKRMTDFRNKTIVRGVAPETVNTYQRHIKAALHWAVDQGYIKVVPKIRMVKTGNRLPAVLSPEQVATLLETAKSIDHDIWRLAGFAVWTGARLSEILGLKWQQVTESAARVTGKGDKERMIPLLPQVRDYLGHQADLGPVFKPMHPDTASHKFKAIAILAGMPPWCHFHTLRHSAATQMLKSGIKLEVIQKILGHVDLRTTQIYAQVLDEMVGNEMEKMSW